MPLDPDVLGRAGDLAWKHRLRGVDAIHLALAHWLSESLRRHANSLIFITADIELRRAAQDYVLLSPILRNSPDSGVASQTWLVLESLTLLPEGSFVRDKQSVGKKFHSTDYKSSSRFNLSSCLTSLLTSCDLFLFATSRASGVSTITKFSTPTRATGFPALT